jgi:hypothetical protein
MSRFRLAALLVPALLALAFSFFAMVSTFAAKPREEVLRKGKGPIPPEWEWVVPNHGSYYPWPFHGPVVGLLFLLAMIGCVVFIVVIARRFPKKP